MLVAIQQLRSQAPSSTVFHGNIFPVSNVEYVAVGGASFVKTNAQHPTSYRYTSSIIDIHHYSLVISHIVVSISITLPSFWPLESTYIIFMIPCIRCRMVHVKMHEVPNCSTYYESSFIAHDAHPRLVPHRTTLFFSASTYTISPCIRRRNPMVDGVICGCILLNLPEVILH